MCEDASVANYTIAPAHSSAQFSVRHMMFSNVKGGEAVKNVAATAYSDTWSTRGQYLY